MIFYYGAAFTAVWATYMQSPVNPGKHASLYELAEISESDLADRKE
jgi:hypothetical protein